MRPWDDPAQLTTKRPRSASYGYVDKTQTLSCSETFLVTKCGTDSSVLMVWTPASPHLVVPEEVPLLHDALRSRATSLATRQLAITGAVFAAALAIVFVGGYYRHPGSLPVFLVGAVGVWFATSLDARRRARRALDPDRLEATISQRRHAVWLSAQPSPYTQLLGYCIIAVGITEMISRKAIPAAGLVKAAVRHGEIWRMVTAPFLHVSYMHFAFNYGALLAFGRLVETHVRGRWVPVVFCATAICGSAASVMLLTKTSVGASGGIMGLLGFLAVIGYSRRNEFPLGFQELVWRDVIGTAVLGLVGFAFIDNAAHAGGFLSGMAFAAALESPLAQRLPVSHKILDLVGPAGIAIAMSAAFLAIVAILRS
jgi:membrane associated rhomboid family serine protease